MNDCKTFVWYTSWRYCLEALERDERMDVIEALWDYVEFGEEPQLPKAQMVAFRAIRKQIDIAKRKHDDFRETKRRAARCRWNKEGDPPDDATDAKEDARTDRGGWRTAATMPEKGIPEGSDDARGAQEGTTLPAAASAAETRRKGEKPKVEKKGEAVPYEEIRQAWCELCTGLPQPKVINSGRKRRIALRVAEMGGAAKALPLLRELMERMARSSFLQGQNKTGWKATFDWLFENPTNWVKVMEGNYDDAPADVPALPFSLDSITNLPNTYTHGNITNYAGARANCRAADADAARRAEFARHIFNKLNGPRPTLPDLEKYY